MSTAPDATAAAIAAPLANRVDLGVDAGVAKIAEVVGVVGFGAGVERNRRDVQWVVRPRREAASGGESGAEAGE